MAEVTGVICIILNEPPLIGDAGELGTVNMFFIVFVGDANVSKTRCKMRDESQSCGKGIPYRLMKSL
jgi:hypothetical protein